MLNRRNILKILGASAVAAGMPNFAFANTGNAARFVLVILRGAVDGLALAAPYGDGKYASVRGELALPKPGQQQGLNKLDGMFGLHPSLVKVFELFEKNEAAVIHAVAGPYRERSHFDGQDMLENGAARVGALRDGWLNRSLAPLGGALGSGSKTATDSAIALAQNTPLVLRGDNSVSSWAPSRLPDADVSTLIRLQSLYANDEFFATRLEQALRSQEIAGGMGAAVSRGNEMRQFGDTMKSAARFMTVPDGPAIAVVEFGGWDTHANQGSSSGALANRFAALDRGLGNLRHGLDEAWKNTVVAVVTEFGRTAHVNGTRGTDHGTGTAACLLGGAVNGGRVVADWPGLGKNDLYAGRDLMPTADIRSVFKGILIEHLRLDGAFVEREVFPDSAIAKPIGELIRS